MRKIILFIFLFIFLFSFQVFAEEEVVPEILETKIEMATDTTPPTITLIEDALITITIGDIYTDAGATASDETDGDVTSQIETIGSVDTMVEGIYTVTYTVRDTVGNIAKATRTVTVIPLPETILIRNGETVIYNGSIALPSSGTIDIPDNTGTIHTVDARSILGLIYLLDQAESSFEISDLAYYTAYNSFYLRCLRPAEAEAMCDNWQYVVGGTTPGASMDQTILSGGETIGLYFGNPHQVVFDTTAIISGESFDVTAEKYNYTDNTWEPLSGITIGVTVPNPNDIWNPIVISEAPVAENGVTSITIAEPGTYTLGIKEDYYFPAYTVVAGIKQRTTSGTGTTIPTVAFDIKKAIEFLASKQNSDGSFNSPLYSDWAAIAFAAGNPTSPNTAKLKTYLVELQDPGSLVTDSERHAMALMAVGADPAKFIAKITQAYDGTQIGDPSLYNDDIFALFPLLRAGYTPSDPMIQNTIGFILSKQNANGGWGSPDMTAAAVQGLTLAGVSDGIEKAKEYLKSGGFENSSSASWILQAIAALNETSNEWRHNNVSPHEYLISTQYQDGGVDSGASDNMRIWATAYAIPGAMGKTWGSILQSFEKPIIENPGMNGITIPKTADIETPTEPEIVIERESEPEVLVAAEEVIEPEMVPVVTLTVNTTPLKTVAEVEEKIILAQETESIQPQTANVVSGWQSFTQTKTAVWLRSAVSRVKYLFSYLLSFLRR